jgi:hypothetical protein
MPLVLRAFPGWEPKVLTKILAFPGWEPKVLTKILAFPGWEPKVLTKILLLYLIRGKEVKSFALGLRPTPYGVPALPRRRRERQGPALPRLCPNLEEVKSERQGPRGKR